MDKVDVKEVVLAFFDGFAHRDADRWVGLFAEDAVLEDPVGAPPARGHEAIRKFYDNLGSMWRELTMMPEAIFVRKNEAAVKFAARGTGTAGLPAQFDGIDTFEIDEAGKIRRVRGYWDVGALMRQLK